MYSTASTFQEIEDFETALIAAGSGLMSIRVPVVQSDGTVDETVPPDAGEGADPADPVSPRHGVLKYFEDQDGPHEVQVKVERIGTSGLSDWCSFEEALAFVQPATT